MRPIAVVGVVLILLGIVALAYQRINYTKRETIVDIGPIHATADRDKTVALPPALGLAVLAGGVVLLVVGVRQTR
jgi:uncharacterized membrane protein